MGSRDLGVILRRLWRRRHLLTRIILLHRLLHFARLRGLGLRPGLLWRNAVTLVGCCSIRLAIEQPVGRSRGSLTRFSSELLPLRPRLLADCLDRAARYDLLKEANVEANGHAVVGQGSPGLGVRLIAQQPLRLALLA